MLQFHFEGITNMFGKCNINDFDCGYADLRARLAGQHYAKTHTCCLFVPGANHSTRRPFSPKGVFPINHHFNRKTINSTPLTNNARYKYLYSHFLSIKISRAE